MSLPPLLRLGDLTGGRDNNILLLRFVAALAVILFHCYALTGRWTDEPLWKAAPELNLGAIGVKMFFVISGFLVTQSWITRQRLDQFVVARVLRIYPALVAATLWTIALAALSSYLPATAFFTHPQTGDYFWRTALAVDTREGLPGAFAGNPFPHAVNGSLWTLPIELRLYLALALAGVVGLVTRRALWLLAVCRVDRVDARAAGLGIGGDARTRRADRHRAGAVVHARLARLCMARRIAAVAGGRARRDRAGRMEPRRLHARQRCSRRC